MWFSSFLFYKILNKEPAQTFSGCSQGDGAACPCKQEVEKSTQGAPSCRRAD